MIKEEEEQACSGGRALPLDSVLARSSIWTRKIKTLRGEKIMPDELDAPLLD